VSVARCTPQRDLWPHSTSLAELDYADAFEVSPAPLGDRRPEDWMRRALEGAPLPLRWFVRAGWRFILGFRPARSASILGWPIVATTDEFVLVEQRSGLMDAALLLRAQPSGLRWETHVRHKAKASVAVWTIVGLLHRRIVPYVLNRLLDGDGDN
jgi:hypothetical protein